MVNSEMSIGFLKEPGSIHNWVFTKVLFQFHSARLVSQLFFFQLISPIQAVCVCRKIDPDPIHRFYLYHIKCEAHIRREGKEAAKTQHCSAIRI